MKQKYDWPMEGYLQAFAPPIQSTGKKGSTHSILPARLQVIRNGDDGSMGPVTVVGPNLTSVSLIFSTEFHFSVNKFHTDLKVWILDKHVRNTVLRI